LEWRLILSTEALATPPEGETEGRSARKHRTILEAARAVFLRNGYLGTSMDEIAAAASVSKQTVYKHFSDKESLFNAVIDSTIVAFDNPFFDSVAALTEEGDVKEKLREVGRQLMYLLMQPTILQLRRLVIGEAARFPDLGRRVAERGQEPAMTALAKAFEKLAAKGALQVEDTSLAAAHFSWLILSIPLNRAMFTGDDTPFSEEELDHFVEEGIRVFLAAYGANAPARPT
jgi:TetR/AcrR family transcriptional regulator, mexJK operon transcriptional repressor